MALVQNAISLLSSTSASMGLYMKNSSSNTVILTAIKEFSGAVREQPSTMKPGMDTFTSIQAKITEPLSGVDVLFLFSVPDDSQKFLVRVFIPSLSNKLRKNNSMSVTMLDTNSSGSDLLNNREILEFTDFKEKQTKAVTSDGYKLEKMSTTVSNGTLEDVIIGGNLITVRFAITNTHSQGKWIIEIEDNVEIDDAQSVKEEEFVIANDAIFGPTPFLMKSDLGTKRATDVDIKITKKQFSGWKNKSRKKMQDNYNKKLKKK